MREGTEVTASLKLHTSSQSCRFSQRLYTCNTSLPSLSPHLTFFHLRRRRNNHHLSIYIVSSSCRYLGRFRHLRCRRHRQHRLRTSCPVAVTSVPLCYIHQLLFFFQAGFCTTAVFVSVPATTFSFFVTFRRRRSHMTPRPAAPYFEDCWPISESQTDRRQRQQIPICTRLPLIN